MQKVLTAAEMREVDRLTTEQYGIPSILLMENAAHAVARVITEKLGGSVKGKTAIVLCGPGNNGGDGAALARYLFTQWVDTEVYLFGTVDQTRGDARTNFEIVRKLAARQPPFWPSFMLYENASANEHLRLELHHADFVIDALFGTGLTRPLSDSFAELFQLIEDIGSERKNGPLLVSIDIPSGVDADQASGLAPSFRADVTVTFTTPKPANVLPPNSSLCGELFTGDIGTGEEIIIEADSEMFLSEATDAKHWLREARFSDSSYKNKRGHCLIVAGSEQFSGAAVLAGDAAMRSGVGLVTVATPKSSKESIATRVLPEVMVRGVAETDDGAVAEEAYEELGELLEKANAVAVGSGLSQSESTRTFVQKLIEGRKQPVVVDADALNLLSPLQKPARSKGIANGESQLILTPHEGEFMRLLGTDNKDALKDRVQAVRNFSREHNVILVLKGERVLIGEPGGKVVVNPTGNSGLGKAGNGDTLTGIIAGFATQAAAMNIDIFETVVAAVYVAGMAGDVAEKKFGKRVMTASDVRECLIDVFSSLAAD